MCVFDTGLTKSKLVFSKTKRKINQQKNGDLTCFDGQRIATDVDLTRQEHVQQEDQEECMYPDTAWKKGYQL